MRVLIKRPMSFSNTHLKTRAVFSVLTFHVCHVVQLNGSIKQTQMVLNRVWTKRTNEIHLYSRYHEMAGHFQSYARCMIICMLCVSWGKFGVGRNCQGTLA